MNGETRAIDIFPIALMGGLFVVIDLLAFAITGPFEAAGEVAYLGSGPGDPVNLVFFFVSIVISTSIVLVIAKYRKTRVIQAVFLGSTGLLGIYVFFPLLSYIPSITWELSLILSAAIMAVLVGLLVKYPEWYVVDASGLITSIGAIAMLGISLSILIAIAVLIVMALYDAISVYKTKHMITLASTLIDLKLPSLFVIPKTKKYSLVKETVSLKEKLQEGEKRNAFLLGLGDIVIPGILAVAAFYNIAGNGFLIGLSVIMGTLAGFSVLMVFVRKGKPQAGLPFLCPGAILGYVISSLILTGGLAAFSL
jgi:presenilin-like A22 family membrane protease